MSIYSIHRYQRPIENVKFECKPDKIILFGCKDSEDKKFRIGRFYERIQCCHKYCYNDYFGNLEKYVLFINDISNDLLDEIRIDHKMLRMIIELYSGLISYKCVEYGRIRYYIIDFDDCLFKTDELFENWERNGIIYIDKYGRLKMLAGGYFPYDLMSDYDIWNIGGYITEQNEHMNDAPIIKIITDKMRKKIANDEIV